MLIYPQPVTLMIDGNSMTFTASCDDSQTASRGNVYMDPGNGATPTLFYAFTHSDLVERTVSGFQNADLQFVGEPGTGGPAMALADPNGSIGIMFTVLGNPATQVTIDPASAVWSNDGTHLYVQVPAAAQNVTGVKVDYSLVAVGSDGAGGIKIGFPIVP